MKVKASQEPVLQNVASQQLTSSIEPRKRSSLIVVGSVQEAHFQDDLWVAQTVVVDVDLIAQHQQAGKGDANTEDDKAKEANSKGEGEVPAMEAHGAHVQHPVAMAPGCLHSSRIA